MKGLKFAIVTSFILAASALGGAGFLYQHYQAEKALRSSLETENAELQQKGMSMQSQVSKLEDDVEHFRSQIRDYVSQRESLKKELDQIHEERAGLQKHIRELESQKNSLTERVNVGEVTEEALVDEANKVVAVTPPADAPPTPIVVLPSSPPAEEEAPQKSEEKAVPSKPEEKPKAEPEPPAAPVAPPPVDQRPNQVLSVNRKFNFVVVNMGLRGHLKIGDMLRVEQNGKLIGRIQIEKLYENFSACTILEEIKPAQIEEGDLVRLA